MLELYRTGVICFEIFNQNTYLIGFVTVNVWIHLNHVRVVPLSNRCPLPFCGLVNRSYSIVMLASSSIPFVHQRGELVHCNRLSADPQVLEKLAKNCRVQK